MRILLHIVVYLLLVIDACMVSSCWLIVVVARGVWLDMLLWMLIGYMCCLLLMWRVWLLVDMHYFSAMLVAPVFVLHFCCLIIWSWPSTTNVKVGVIEDVGLDFVYDFHQCQRGVLIALWCACFQLVDVAIGSWQ